MRRASSKSPSVSPPSLCVVMVTVTVFQEISRSGWWFISSASGVSRFTNSTEPLKSPLSNCFTIASPERSQPSRPARRSSISPSLRRAILVSVRIASLVPSATEMLFALGLGDRVAAVTHECDYPPGAEQLPHLTRSVIPEGLPAAEIDAAVRERTGRGESLYELDETTLEQLGVDLIVTQAVCDVCAVSFDDVRAVAERLPTQPEVISLDPSTLGEVLADVPRLAQAAGVEEAGEELAEESAARIEAVEQAVKDAPRPRVAALEWLDPIYVGGHWVPQMIELAGGLDVLGSPGEKSRTADWAEVEALSPEVVVSMPCGYYAEQAAAETMKQRDRLAPLGARVIAVDAAAYFSRPGPRLVDGVELLGHLFPPELVPAPPTRRSIELDLAASPR